MGMFKKEVGRPSNETIKKRNIFKLICIILILLIIGLVIYILNDNGIINFKSKKVNNEPNFIKTKTTTTKVNEEKVSFDISYKEEEYRKKIDGTEYEIINKRNLPIIKSNQRQDIADKITENLKKISDDFWNNSIIPQTNDSNIKDKGLGANYMMKDVYMTKSFISFEFNSSGGFGGVSWDNTLLKIYSTKTGDELTFSEIAKDEKEFTSYIKKELREYLLKNYASTYNENLIDEYSWNINGKGLSICYERGKMGSLADGTIIISFTFDEINEYLKDEYK